MSSQSIKKFLNNIFSIKNEEKYNVVRFLGFKFKFKQQVWCLRQDLLSIQEDLLLYKKDLSTILSELNTTQQGFNDLKTYLENQKIISQVHKKTLMPFKNIHSGQTACIVATGPTLEYAPKIDNFVSFGVNKSFMAVKNLNYLFMQDYKAVGAYIEQANDYPCVKFYGKFVDNQIQDYIGIPYEIIEKSNAKIYYNNFPCRNIYDDIENNALMDFSSVVFPAIHLALYTGIKTLYLIGCDCSNAGYFDNSTQKVSLDVERTIEGYKQLKEFCSLFYPDVKIVSINPIGLKGIFKDVYTRAYVSKHQELSTETLELLD